MSSKREFKVIATTTTVYCSIIRKCALALLIYSMSRGGEMRIRVPPLSLFFMSREKLGFCLIRRHGCPRKSESHDAASSPQSTVSTLGEGGGLGSGDPRGKSTWCFLFGATSNPGTAGWIASFFFLNLWLVTQVSEEFYIISHTVFFSSLKIVNNMNEIK